MSGIMCAFFAVGEPTVTLNNVNALSDVITPTNALCQYELTSGGDVRMTQTNNTVNDVGDWVAAVYAPGSYECLLHVNSGTSPSGSALDTWLALTSTRNWQLSRTSLGTSSNNCTISIRKNGVTLASATVTMTATKST